MKTIILILLASIGSAFAGDLEIKDAWVRAVPPSMSGSAAFFTIKNHGSKPVKLIGAKTVLAKTAEPMVTTHRAESGQDVMGMKTVESIEIPAGGEIKLQPGGDHLMLMGLNQHPKPGDKVVLILQFSPSQEVKIEAEVR